MCELLINKVHKSGLLTFDPRLLQQQTCVWINIQTNILKTQCVCASDSNPVVPCTSPRAPWSVQEQRDSRAALSRPDSSWQPGAQLLSRSTTEELTATTERRRTRGTDREHSHTRPVEIRSKSWKRFPSSYRSETPQDSRSSASCSRTLQQLLQRWFPSWRTFSRLHVPPCSQRVRDYKQPPFILGQSAAGSFLHRRDEIWLSYFSLCKPDACGCRAVWSEV